MILGLKRLPGLRQSITLLIVKGYIDFHSCLLIFTAGDPLFHHASHIVIASPPKEPIYLNRLSASLRIANSVRKALVIATTATRPDNDGSNNNGSSDVAYTTLYWTGSRTPSVDVKTPFWK